MKRTSGGKATPVFGLDNKDNHKSWRKITDRCLTNITSYCSCNYLTNDLSIVHEMNLSRVERQMCLARKPISCPWNLCRRATCCHNHLWVGKLVNCPWFEPWRRAKAVFDLENLSIIHEMSLCGRATPRYRCRDPLTAAFSLENLSIVHEMNLWRRATTVFGMENLSIVHEMNL